MKIAGPDNRQRDLAGWRRCSDELRRRLHVREDEADEREHARNNRPLHRRHHSRCKAAAVCRGRASTFLRQRRATRASGWVIAAAERSSRRAPASRPAPQSSSRVRPASSCCSCGTPARTGSGGRACRMSCAPAGSASMAARRSAGMRRRARAAHRRVGGVPAAVGLRGIHLPLTVRRHPAGGSQPRDVIAVDLAPDAARAAAACSAAGTSCSSNDLRMPSIHPQHKHDVERLRGGHRRQTGALLVDLQPDLGRASMVRRPSTSRRPLRCESS